jgi:hypothetical protein
LLSPKEFSLAKGLMNAENLGNHLGKYMFSLYTREYTLDKGLMSVRNVADH